MTFYSRFFLAVSLLFIANISHAQEVTYSQYEKFGSNAGDNAVVGVVGNTLYTYRYEDDQAMLDAYDDSMNKTATIILDFFPSKIYQTRFIAYPDKIVVLYQALESNKVVQYAAMLDARARLRKRPVELASVRVGILGATKNYFFSAVSDDKKRIVVYSAEGKGSEIIFDGKWISDSATIIGRGHTSFRSDNPIDFGEVNVGNDGTVYMAAYTPIGSLNYADHFMLLCLKQGENKFEPKTMDISNKYAASGYIKIDNSAHRVYFGGFYSNKKNGTFDGIIFSSFNTDDNAFASVKFLPIDEEMLAIAGAKSKNHAFDNYEVKQLIVKNDGGFVLVSEVHYVTTRSNYSPGIGYGAFYSSGTTNLVREYHYNDIMAISYNNEGKRQWMTMIPKEQFSQEDGGLFSSYTLLNSGGTLAFLYNDFNRTHSRIQLSTIDADGKTGFHSFASEGNDNPDWLPKLGKQVSSRALIVPCLHKKEVCYAKVLF